MSVIYKVKIVKDTGWKITSESSAATDYIRTVCFNFSPTKEQLEEILNSSGANERKHLRKIARCTYIFIGTLVRLEKKTSRTLSKPRESQRERVGKN